MLHFKPPRLQSSPEFIPDPNEDINNNTPQNTINAITSGAVVEDQAGTIKDEYQTVTPQVSGNVADQIAPSGATEVRDELPVNVDKDTNSVPAMTDPVVSRETETESEIDIWAESGELAKEDAEKKEGVN